MTSCELDVKVTPRSRRNEASASSGTVKVWVTAAPADGQANEAVIEALAKALQLPKSRIAIVRGATSRQKRIRIEGVDAAEALRRLGGP